MNKTVKRVLFIAVIAILLVVFLYSAFHLGKYLVESFSTKRDYDKLSGLVNQNRPSRPPVTTPAPTEPGTPESPPQETVEPTLPAYVTITHPDTGEEMQILPEYAEVFQENTDMVGWICIPGTVIDYPVMQTPDYPDYYLRRDFNKKYNLHGCIYAREQCDINTPSDNITMYGHRMSDGSMFAQLINYTKESFFQDNRYIYFDTLTERHTYEIFAVFKTTATLGQGFQYHLFVNAKTESAFNDFVNTCKSNAFYDTGITPVYGDKLITLSTCEYSQENGRLVVVAKRIS